MLFLSSVKEIGNDAFSNDKLDFVTFHGEPNVALGDENGYFRPNENLTRAQFTAFMYRALGL
ncbi:S-layer homology domain-containing protein [Lysinibacillus agricola]|uniref:S-layer homology domain-containing protein n=1 Tax=Lysinibacillus agricola TaxID=2590012 RepID=UPI003C13C259